MFRGLTSVFEVQRFWIREIFATSLQPVVKAPSQPSKGLSPPYSPGNLLAQAKLQLNSNSANQSTNTVNQPMVENEWALTPWLLQSDSCQRCGAKFDIKYNFSDSCRFHADAEGIHYCIISLMKCL
jgi:hypothetical protein